MFKRSNVDPTALAAAERHAAQTEAGGRRRCAPARRRVRRLFERFARRSAIGYVPRTGLCSRLACLWGSRDTVNVCRERNLRVAQDYRLALRRDGVYNGHVICRSQARLPFLINGYACCCRPRASLVVLWSSDMLVIIGGLPDKECNSRQLVHREPSRRFSGTLRAGQRGIESRTAKSGNVNRSLTPMEPCFRFCASASFG
jgi:hypothetical protein